MPKSIKTRIQNKHDIEANWLQATGFIPLAGELIIYDVDDTHDLPRIKIGDGETQVSQLDFLNGDIDAVLEELANKADKEHGTHVSYSTTSPVMDGTASAGTANTVARSDHKHPVDTSRAAQSDLAAHTDNTTAHITATERTNWNAAYTHSQAAHAPSNAEKNQNAFSNVTVGSTTIAADSVTDTITLVAGNNVTITPDATNDKITIAATDTVYTHPTSGVTAGTYKSVTVDSKGHVTAGTNPTTLAGYGITDAESKGAAANALSEAKSYADEAINNLISCGTADPSADITSKFYFKYSID